jgi:hypothetical protein
MVKLSQLTSALVVTWLSGIQTNEEDQPRTLSQFHMGIVVRFFYFYGWKCYKQKVFTV